MLRRRHPPRSKLPDPGWSVLGRGLSWALVIMAPLFMVLELRSPEPDDVELGLSALLLLSSLSHVIGHAGRARSLLSYALDLVGLVVLLLLVQRCAS